MNLEDDRDTSPSLPFPTDPTDPKWPFPISGTGPFIPAQFHPSGMICVCFGSRQWCFNPSSNSPGFFCGKCNEGPNLSPFVDFRTDSKKDQNSVETEIHFLTQDGIDGKIHMVAKAVKASDCTAKSNSDLAVAIAFSLDKTPLFSVHYHQGCPVFKWLAKPPDSQSDPHKFERVLVAITTAVQYALNNGNLSIQPPQQASVCEKACGAAGTVVGSAAGAGIAGACTGASIGVAAPGCTYFGFLAGVAIGAVSDAGCSSLFCD